MSYSRASNSDGQRQAASVARPFYALDTPWAAGVSASAHTVNVTKEEDWARAVAAVLTGAGAPGRIDVHVQAAGITGEQ
jgi:hypothetical protein